MLSSNTIWDGKPSALSLFILCILALFAGVSATIAYFAVGMPTITLSVIGSAAFVIFTSIYYATSKTWMIVSDDFGEFSVA